MSIYEKPLQELEELNNLKEVCVAMQTTIYCLGTNGGGMSILFMNNTTTPPDGLIQLPQKDSAFNVNWAENPQEVINKYLTLIVLNKGASNVVIKVLKDAPGVLDDTIKIESIILNHHMIRFSASFSTAKYEYDFGFYTGAVSFSEEPFDVGAIPCEVYLNLGYVTQAELHHIPLKDLTVSNITQFLKPYTQE